MKCFVERRKYWLAALSCCLMDYYRCCTRSRLQQEFKPPARTPEGSSVHISLQPALHKIQQKAPIEWTAENIWQYDAEQYKSDVSIREHFCAVHVKLPQSVQVFICTLLFLCLPQCAVFQCSLDWQIGFKQTWFLLIYVFALWVFLYLYYHVVVWLCIQAHVNFHCKVERCLTSLWFYVILYLLLLYFCIYAFVYFSVLVHWWEGGLSFGLGGDVVL